MLTRTTIPTPAESEAVVRAMAAATDQEFRESWTLTEAANFLRSCDYACTPGILMRLVSREYVSDPRGDWRPQHVHCAAAALESRRRWQPTPSRHDAKKSAARLQIETARKEGIDVFNDLDATTLEDLLIQLTQTDQRQIREVLYEAVREKMDRLAFVEE